MKMRRFFACFAFAAVVGTSFGQVVLSDGNSIANIDPTSANFPFLRGLNSWEVDEVNQVFQQWYWFRIGEGRERSIDTISTPEISQPSANSVNIAYADDRLAIDVTFTLVGGTFGSGTSDISEVVRVRNRTNGSLNFHLFEYDDFDASGTFDDDFGQLMNSSTARVSDAFTRIDVGAVPIPDRWQISAVPDIFDLLEDGGPSTLSNSSTFGGPGDVAFAFQWDRTLEAGGTFLLSKNKLVTPVPEPGSLIAIGVGLGWLSKRRSYRRTRQ
jgi:hypothetical protein